jgi:hypothetical protein
MLNVYTGIFSDKEHVEMIRLYVEEELGINKIAEKPGRSSRTPLVQIHKHNKAVERSGFCPICRRVGSKYESESAQKGICQPIGTIPRASFHK